MPSWFDALWRQTPYTGEVLAATVVVALVAAVVLPRRLRVPALGAAAWVGSLGLVVALTLTPRTTWVEVATERVCTFDTWAPLGLDSLLAFDQRAANAALLVPIALLSALPRDRRTVALALTASAALPVVVEALQYALPALGRVCHSEDLVDNLTGVAAGALVGLVVRGVRGRRRGAGRARRSARSVGAAA